MKFEIKNNIFLILLILPVLSVIYFAALKQTRHKTDSSYIFIGGKARSGTTLMRAILDIDPTIKCGFETKIPNKFVDKFIDRLPNLNSINFKHDFNQAAKTFITNIIIGRNLSQNRQCIIYILIIFTLFFG